MATQSLQLDVRDLLSPLSAHGVEAQLRKLAGVHRAELMRHPAHCRLPTTMRVSAKRICAARSPNAVTIVPACHCPGICVRRPGPLNTTSMRLPQHPHPMRMQWRMKWATAQAWISRRWRATCDGASSWRWLFRPSSWRMRRWAWTLARSRRRSGLTSINGCLSWPRERFCIRAGHSCGRPGMRCVTVCSIWRCWLF